MAESQQRRKSIAQRGILARPLDALIFLLPLIVVAEMTAAARGRRVIAFDLVHSFFELFGRVGAWAPPLAVVAILLATHIVSDNKWTVRFRAVAWMYLEAAALSLPLLLLGRFVPLAVSGVDRLPLLDRVALSIGAGIYEELVFRLAVISLIMMIGVDLLRRNRANVTVAAVVVSSLAFAAHHYLPIGQEAFDLTSFLFRTVAGLYLALVFWYRGYGPAAGCHAAYNVSLTLLALMGR